MDILAKKLILFTNECKSVYSLMEKDAELNCSQVVAGEKIELSPRSQKRIRCLLREEVKSRQKNYIRSGKERTIGPIEVIPEKNIIVWVINSDENLTLKPLKQGLREDTLHQKRLKKSFIRGKSKQVANKGKVESEKTMRKLEELLQFLQSKQTNTATVTTTDSNEWWEKQIGNACTVPSHVISKEKMEDNILVDTTIPLKKIPKKPMKTRVLEN